MVVVCSQSPTEPGVTEAEPEADQRPASRPASSDLSNADIAPFPVLQFIDQPAIRRGVPDMSCAGYKLEEPEYMNAISIERRAAIADVSTRIEPRTCQSTTKTTTVVC